jgi:hypothetical protein
MYRAVDSERCPVTGTWEHRGQALVSVKEEPADQLSEGRLVKKGSKKLVYVVT